MYAKGGDRSMFEYVVVIRVALKSNQCGRLLIVYDTKLMIIVAIFD